MLNARSLAAELAGTVNKARANGRKALNRFSLKTLIPWPPTSSAENDANCFLTLAIVSCVDDWELVLDADDDMNENSLALFDTVGLQWLTIFHGDATACADDCEWLLSEVDELQDAVRMPKSYPVFLELRLYIVCILPSEVSSLYLIWTHHTRTLWRSARFYC